MGDRVRVSHHYEGAPCLELVGRGHDTSDLVGEKLHEDFVAQALTGLPLDFANLWSLLPCREPRDHYVLLVDRPPENLRTLADEIDRALCGAHHYAQARALGQLGPAQVVVQPRAAEMIRDHQTHQGVPWGNLKHRLLFTHPADQLLRGALAS
jgi:hypothetical protein